MGQAVDILSLSGMEYPIHILAPTFSTVSLGSVVLRYAKHAISGRIFPGRLLGEITDSAVFGNIVPKIPPKD